jgi:Zn-dependent M28 family amino/carboxypeptidase
MIRFSPLAISAAALLSACSPQSEPEIIDSAFVALPVGTEACTPDQEAAVSANARAALVDMCVLSSDVMAGRLVGAPGNAMARDYIVQRFEALDLAPLGDSFEHPFTFDRSIDFRDPNAARESVDAVNVIALIPGADSAQIMVVTAHYDHIGPGENNEIFNGADDNASGVGGLLAVAQHFHDNPPAHDVLIVAFDAEESGLSGARHFVENQPDGLGEVVLNLNLDMLGYSPEGDIWAAGAYHTPGLMPLIEAAADAASVQLKAGYDRPTGDPREDWTLLSDHGPFHVAGIPFIYIGVEDHEHYHQVSDEFSIIDPVFYGAVVDMVVDLAERADDALGEIAEMEPRSDSE